MDMERFSSADCQRHWGKIQDIAIVRPVTISNNGRDRLVMLSIEEYSRLKRRDRWVMDLADFTDADIAAIESARAPETSAMFDHEVSG